VSKILFGVTVSVPCFGGGGVAEGVLAGVVLLDGAGDVLWLDEGAVADGELPPLGPGEPPPVGAGELPAEGPGDTRDKPLADTVGCAVRLGPPDEAPDEAPDEGPEEAPGVAPDVPPALLPGPPPRAFGRPLCPASPPLSARLAITTAPATTTAAAAPWVVRACHHGDFGGSSGLGKPWWPNIAARCATSAR